MRGGKKTRECDVLYWGVLTSSSAWTTGGRAWKETPSQGGSEFSMWFHSAAVSGVHPTGTSGGREMPNGVASTSEIKLGQESDVRVIPCINARPRKGAGA